MFSELSLHFYLTRRAVLERDEKSFFLPKNGKTKRKRQRARSHNTSWARSRVF